jgi:hypothetical protein
VGKRGTRRITANGSEYRWRCEFNDPAEKFSKAYAEHGKSWSPDILVVRPVDRPYRLLTVTWPACDGPAVMPRVVRAAIDEAIRRGWLAELANMTLPGIELSIPDEDQGKG